MLEKIIGGALATIGGVLAGVFTAWFTLWLAGRRQSRQDKEHLVRLRLMIVDELKANRDVASDEALFPGKPNPATVRHSLGRLESSISLQVYQDFPEGIRKLPKTEMEQVCNAYRACCNCVKNAEHCRMLKHWEDMGDKSVTRSLEDSAEKIIQAVDTAIEYIERQANTTQAK